MIVNNDSHLFHSLLPSERCDRYSVRAPPHNFKLPVKITLSEINFITRMLYQDNCYHYHCMYCNFILFHCKHSGINIIIIIIKC